MKIHAITGFLCILLPISLRFETVLRYSNSCACTCIVNMADLSDLKESRRVAKIKPTKACNKITRDVHEDMDSSLLSQQVSLLKVTF